MNTLMVVEELVEARPTAVEVAVIHLPVGAVARVHHPSGVCEYVPAVPGIPYYLVVPGDKTTIGWGWDDGWYGDLRSVRNGHHRLDRAVWHTAAQTLRQDGVVYVRYEQQPYYDKPRWTAVGVRVEGGGR